MRNQNYLEMEKYDVKIKVPEIPVILSDTIDFFNELKKPKQGIIKSNIAGINDLEIEFQSINDKLEFSTESLKIPGDPKKHLGHGLMEEFEIITDSKKYILKNGVRKFSFKISQSSATGQPSEIAHNHTDSVGFFRVASPIDGYTKIPNKYFGTNPFKIGTSIRGAGYLKVKIDNFNLGFFDYEIEKKNYVFIECHNQINNIQFEKLVECILYSFALISGCLINSTYNYLKFQNNNFTQLEGFYIKEKNKSVITNNELFNTREFKSYYELESLYFMPEVIFSNLANVCYNNPTFLRAIRILTQARNQPVEIEAASIFVALETLKNLILKDAKNDVLPFKDKKIADETIKELKLKITSMDDIHFNNKNSILNKIQDLNKAGNNEGFRLAFQIAGFNLTGKDLKCLAMRNRFLHGNMPHDNDVEEIRIKELARISLSAHFLTCCLFLKCVGYSGYVKNFLKYLDIVNEFDEVDEELFRKI